MSKKIKRKIKKPVENKLKKDNVLIRKEIKEKKAIKPAEKDTVDKIKKIKIRVIGIGGGGSAIVSEIASRVSKAIFTVANTDIQALKTINKKVDYFQFGQSLTDGLGTGMNIDLGREAAENEKDKIEKLCQGYDLCIIIACLGGGTGSGAASVFAKISKSLGNLTYGIFTLPFKFEGEKKMEIAKESLEKVKNYLDAITIIPNEKIFQTINKDVPLKQAFSLVNKNLAKSLEGLIETIYNPGLVNIDFADFKTIFHSKGKLTYLNTVETSRKEGLTKDLINQIFISPLCSYTIEGAKGVLFNVVGEKKLLLSEVDQISKNILKLVSPEAKIIFGVSHDENLGPIIKTTLLAVGCGVIKEKVIKKKLEIKIKNKKQNKIFQTKSLEKKIEVKVVEDFENKIPQEMIRKNGLQIKKEIQELEEELLEKEKIWDIPAFLRRKS